ncbi:MAG: SMI1/KNR4 family protein [Gemmataceae bacterium]
MPKIFHDFDLAGFWKKSAYARKGYVEAKPTAKDIASIEKELGVRLPASYVELMESQNGGFPKNTCFPTKKRTSWAHDHVAITGFLAIGRTKAHSLCGALGSQFMKEEWGYPDIGVCICDCPSAGHDMIMLDYRACRRGKADEPRVVHVDQELDYRITLLAKDFETFVRGLVNESVYDTSADDLKTTLANIESGSFTSVLRNAIAAYREIDFDRVIRKLLNSLVTEKGYFALHADPKSHLMYDILFLLYAKANGAVGEKKYLEDYPKMLVFGDGAIVTNGYGPAFIEKWLEQRRASGDITVTPSGELGCTSEFRGSIEAKVREFQQA